MSKSKRKINLNDLSKAQTASVAAAAEPEVKTVEVAQPVQKIKPELDADTRAKRQAANRVITSQNSQPSIGERSRSQARRSK